MIASIVAFGISLLLLIAFLGFKTLQQSREIEIYARARERADKAVMHMFRSLKERLVHLEEQLSIGNIVRVVLHYGAEGVARTAGRIESHAADVSMKVSRSSRAARTTRSSFLSEVETHKNGLDTERVRRETRLAPDEDAE